jgi:hypothetical protein
MRYEEIVIREKDVPTVNRLVKAAKDWTVFSLKTDPTKFFIFRLPLTDVVKDHLVHRHGDSLALIYVPHRECCDLCPYPCPNDHAQLRPLTKIGVS